MSVFKCAECSSCRIVCGEVFDELDRMMDVKLKIVHILHLHFSLLMVSIYQTIDSNAMHENCLSPTENCMTSLYSEWILRISLGLWLMLDPSTITFNLHCHWIIFVVFTLICGILFWVSSIILFGTYLVMARDFHGKTELNWRPLWHPWQGGWLTRRRGWRLGRWRADQSQHGSWSRDHSPRLWLAHSMTRVEARLSRR